MVAVTLRNGIAFNATAEESILEAARRQHVVLEHSCRTGRCGVCKARVQSGETVPQFNEEALTAQEVAAGWVLTCARSARTDVALEIEDLGRLADIEVKTLPCRVDALARLAPDVVQLILRLPPTAKFTFLAGQYINLILPSGVRRSYSLASGPRADGKLELHIRAVEGGVMSAYCFGPAAVNDLLRFEGPFGTFCWRDHPGKVIFLATGTGIAPVKAMLEELAATPGSGERPVWVYWGGRKPDDLYCELQFPGLNLRYVPVLSQPHDGWQGRRGYVQEVALQDHADLRDAAVYACGSDAMIGAAREALKSAGLPAANFHSDAFVASS
jgi:CDP-4-dehydro-6-deoxyglucose reductase